MFLVDPFEVIPGGKRHFPDAVEKMRVKVTKWVRGKPITLFVHTSQAIADWCCFHSIYLDWIYIDADHEDLYNDLTNWYDNIKEGGIIMGDDYGNEYPQIEVDLKRFCEERNLKYKTFHYQWWLKKQ